MRVLRMTAVTILAVMLVISLGADWLAPHHYEIQFRDHPNEPPSRDFPLGTDNLGRDRFSRLLYATQISLLIAPTTAGVATVAGTILGLVAGCFRGWVESIIAALTDLFLSLPWLFLLLTLRAILPLDISPAASIFATALLLALVGWGSGARVIHANTHAIQDSEWVVQTRAYGCRTTRLIWFHLMPALRPAISAQFWILVPALLMAEANLGVLGLGVMEPLPSLGNMISELREYQKIPESPWILTPAAVLIVIVASLHFVISRVESCE